MGHTGFNNRPGSEQEEAGKWPYGVGGTALEAAGLESREERGIGTNPTGVKHRSPYSCPIPALTLHHFLTQPPTYPHLATSFVCPFFRPFRFYSYATAFRRFSRKAHTRTLCLPYHRGGSFRVLFASVGSHGNSFSLFLPAYLSISPPSSIVLFHPICSSTDLSLIFLSRFTFPLFSPPSSSDFLCKRPQVDL